MTPEVWAAQAVRKHGPINAAKLASNSSDAWYKHAYNWIVKRYPQAKVKTSEVK